MKIRLLKKCPKCRSTRIDNVITEEEGKLYLVKVCPKCEFKNVTKIKTFIKE